MSKRVYTKIKELPRELVPEYCSDIHAEMTLPKAITIRQAYSFPKQTREWLSDASQYKWKLLSYKRWAPQRHG